MDTLFLFELSLSRLFNDVLCIIERFQTHSNSRNFLFADILKLFVIWTSFIWYIYFKGVVNQKNCNDNISLWIELSAS